jgi:DamX protein
MTSLNAQAETSVVTDYLDYFGLHEDPFSPELLPFYDGGLRRELFAELLHLCQFSASILLVLGEEGVGKASLKTALCQHFSDQDLVCDIDVPLLGNSEWLLDSIGQQLSLGVDSSDTGQAIADIRQAVQDSEDDDCLKVVMIQNAHNLDADSLRILLRLGASGEQSPYRQLHLLLFANPEFEQRLSQEPLFRDPLFQDKRQLLQVFRLPSIAPQEMKHYLRFRLDAAGFSGIFPFKDSDIQFLWDISKGIPAKFHDAARELLIEQALPPPEAKTLGLPATHMAAVVLLLAGLFTAVFYRSSTNDEVTRTIEIAQVQNPPVAEPVATEPDDLSVDRNVVSAATTPIRQQATDAPVEQSNQTVPKPAREPQALPALSESTLSEPKLEAAKPELAKPVDNRPTEKEINALLAAAEKELAQEKISTPPSRPNNTPMQKPVPANLTDDENALLKRSPNNFTLQILASGSREAVNDFLGRQSNRTDLAVFTALRDGLTLYIVVMGSFPSSEAARLAVSQLPQEQRIAGPWPRSFQSVQADIRAFRGF